MVTSKRIRPFTVIILLIGPGFAQRPTNASVCDFYAQTRFGANSSETQLKFIQNVVSLAFEGGSRLNNVSSEITGILRPGKFNGADINLLQYFNGSRASTNVNNAPIGINWMDQGGPTPLAAFLAGESQTLALADGSNQYHLFSNFFVAFSRAFGCTLPPPPLPNTSGPISLAYAHKFMNLEYNQLGYFINQLSLAATHFGVSPQDADTFRTSLNSRFNVRCAPASPMLLSLCQNPTCPLAVPVSDCAAYVNLTAGGVTNSNPTTVTSVQFATTIAAPSGTTASASPTVGTASIGKAGLSTGGIAGVAVGGAAILLVAVIALFYFRPKRRTSSASAPPPAPAAAWDQQNYGSPTVNSTSTYLPKHPHQSYQSTGQPASEMDTSRYTNLTGASSPPASPDPAAHQGFRSYPEQSGEIWRPAPVEMDSARTPGAIRGPFLPPNDVAALESHWQSDISPVPGRELHTQQQHHAQQHPSAQQQHFTQEQYYTQQHLGR